MRSTTTKVTLIPDRSNLVTPHVKVARLLLLTESRTLRFYLNYAMQKRETNFPVSLFEFFVTLFVPFITTSAVTSYLRILNFCWKLNKITSQSQAWHLKNLKNYMIISVNIAWLLHIPVHNQYNHYFSHISFIHKLYFCTISISYFLENIEKCKFSVCILNMSNLSFKLKVHVTKH